MCQALKAEMYHLGSDLRIPLNARRPSGHHRFCNLGQAPVTIGKHLLSNSASFGLT